MKYILTVFAHFLVVILFYQRFIAISYTIRYIFDISCHKCNNNALFSSLFSILFLALNRSLNGVWLSFRLASLDYFILLCTERFFLPFPGPG